MKLKGIIIWVVLVLCLINTGWLIMQYRENRSMVVVDVIKVFNDFKLKKDLEARVEVKLSEFSNAIDSSKAVYDKMAKSNAAREELAGIVAHVDTLQHRAQQAYEISNKNINEQVWQRLNSLLDEYGTQYNYKLVIGANGMGTVLYNQKGIDKTEELIKFINSKYDKGF